MVVIIYNILLVLYKAGISIASLFNQKAKLWLTGRRNLLPQLKQLIKRDTPVIWMHCASLGEFEQGRPVLEQIRKDFPNYKILLSFFSPSGYEIRKNYDGADWVCYLPLDSAGNAREFIRIINPSLVIFVKYEYWYHYLSELHQRQIPTILISAIFQKNAVFFKWYGALQRRMIRFFSQVFVQDKESASRLQTLLPASKITVAGDTRFDRVSAIAQNFAPVPAIDEWISPSPIIVAGSTWPEDEKYLKILLEKYDKIRLIIAPHEITKDHLKFIKSLFPQSILYSEWSNRSSGSPLTNLPRVLVIDNIGMLSRLYYYGSVGYVGGGFNKSGIHNTLEAAVYGRPVVFGPHYQKFAEAISLIKKEGGFTYSTEDELIQIFNKLLSDPVVLQTYSNNAGRFVKGGTGATTLILDWIRLHIS